MLPMTDFCLARCYLRLKFLYAVDWKVKIHPFPPYSNRAKFRLTILFYTYKEPIRHFSQIPTLSLGNHFFHDI